MLQEGLASGKLWFLKSNLFARTVLLLHWRRMALHGFWTLLEVVVRCVLALISSQLTLCMPSQTTMYWSCLCLTPLIAVNMTHIPASNLIC